ncbi:hypothetical protein [Roseivirga sp. E12]|uniref:hypothetical protein n=1 Tax=Roseivirga sp. E12 TaxID=2819237 RepID=UPI001ABBFE02|nr:hypothetical protein [Roseivirga sp. E12]MBO3700286.1 hypothetical protein [Roseivirga sp. E12]
MDNWVIPLTLLPGIGMIIMSTSHLSTATSDEINQLLRDDLCDTSLIKKKISQLYLLNLAKVCLYISVAVFSIAGLIEAIFTLQSSMHDSVIRPILLIIGVSTLVLATLILIVFSTRKVKIKRDQFLNRIKP